MKKLSSECSAHINTFKLEYIVLFTLSFKISSLLYMVFLQLPFRKRSRTFNTQVFVT